MVVISIDFLYKLFLSDPGLSFKEKDLMFIVCSVILLALSYFVNDSINRNQFITIFRENMNNQPDQNFFRPPGKSQVHSDKPGHHWVKQAGGKQT
jgi:hypothetical protein